MGPDHSRIVHAEYRSDATSSNTGEPGQAGGRKGALRDYVEKFSPETVQEMARVVSQEAAQLIEMQTGALFGDYRQLQEQMKVRVTAHGRPEHLHIKA